jgi:DNA end-binding protein Ku
VPKASKRADKEPETEAREAGPRPTWSGTLSFGLVTIPVELYSATRAPTLRAHTVTDDGVRLVRKYYCPKDDRDLESDDLVRGAELPNGKYVIVEDEELRALAPKKSREIALQSFVDSDSLHPSMFEHPYVLAPAADRGASKAYGLLVQVMQKNKRAGIATFVLREREYIIAIVSDGRLLLGQTLRFAAELRTADDIGLPEPEDVSKAQVAKWTKALGGKKHGRFDPSALRDPAEERLAKLLSQKRSKGEVIEPAADSGPDPAAEQGEMLDLMLMLKQSIDQPTNDSGSKRKRAPRKTSGRARAG